MKEWTIPARWVLVMALFVALGAVPIARAGEEPAEKPAPSETHVAQKEAQGENETQEGPERHDATDKLEAQLEEVEKALAELEDAEPSPDRDARMNELRARADELRTKMQEGRRGEGSPPEEVEARLGEIEEEIERLEGEEPNPQRDARLEELRATAKELRARLERTRRPGRGRREVEARRRDLEEKIREIKRRIADWESEPPSPERDRRLEELRRSAREVAGALERLVERGRERWRGRKERREPPLRLEIFNLEHADAGHIAEIIEDFLPPDSRIAFDGRTNKIVVLTTERGIDFAAQIVEALDVPMPREGKARYVPEPERRERRGPRFDYEREDETRFEGKARRSFQRLEGTVVDVSDEAVTIRPRNRDDTVTLHVPKIRADKGEWRVPKRLAQALRDVEPGKHVVAKWWEADDVRYLEDLFVGGRQREREPERSETYLFDR